MFMTYTFCRSELMHTKCLQNVCIQHVAIPYFCIHFVYKLQLAQFFQFCIQNAFKACRNVAYILYIFCIHFLYISCIALVQFLYTKCIHSFRVEEELKVYIQKFVVLPLVRIKVRQGSKNKIVWRNYPGEWASQYLMYFLLHFTVLY